MNIECRRKAFYRFLINKIERSDSILSHSLRGVGPYDPYGFRLVKPTARRGRRPHSLRGVGPYGPYGPEADFRTRQM
jgi:hypothetical protein